MMVGITISGLTAYVVASRVMSPYIMQTDSFYGMLIAQLVAVIIKRLGENSVALVLFHHAAYATLVGLTFSTYSIHCQH